MAVEMRSSGWKQPQWMQKLMPVRRFELLIPCLRDRCLNHWAKPAAEIVERTLGGGRRKFTL